MSNLWKLIRKIAHKSGGRARNKIRIMSPPRPPTPVGPFFFDEGIRGGQAVHADTVLLATRGMRSNTGSSTYDSPCQDYIHVLGVRRHPLCVSPWLLNSASFIAPLLPHTSSSRSCWLIASAWNGVAPSVSLRGKRCWKRRQFRWLEGVGGRNELFASQFSWIF